MKITVIGTGVYSLALAHALSKKNSNKIIMWTHDSKLKEEYNNTKSLKSIIDYKFDSNISITTSLEESLENTNLIIIGVASNYFKNTILNMQPFYKKEIPICIATKGLDDKSKDFLSNILSNHLKTKNVSVLSGPTFAIDIINNEPVALALASRSKSNVEVVKKALENDSLKLRDNKDIIGTQICGSIKNVIAIAVGIINGLGYSNSTTAFLINESVHDIKNTIYYLGGSKKTILSFAGIGDLILTCTSTKSRNYSFGYTIGKHKDKKTSNNFLEDNTVEGYYALETFKNLLKDNKIKVPLINIIYDIVYEDKNPEELIKFLITKS